MTMCLRREGMKFLLMKKPHSDALALDCLTGFLLVVQGWEIAGQRASMRYSCSVAYNVGWGMLPVLELLPVN